MFSPRTYARLFRRWVEFNRGRPGPIEVSWFISTKCNIRCGGCLFFARDGRPSFATDRVLDLDEKLKIVRQLAEIRLPYLAVGGGEPFLEPDLMPLVKALRRAGVACGITTNGIEATAAQLLAYDGLLHVIWISLDGFAPEHDKIRGPGRHAQSLATLKGVLGRMRKTLVGVNTVLNRHNAATIPDFVLFLQGLGVERVGLKVNVMPELQPDFAAHPGALDRLVAIKRRFPSLITITPEFIESIPDHCRPENAKKGCRLDLWTHPSILPDGRLSACAAYPVIVGDLTKEHIRDILDRRDPTAFAAAAECPGCVRGDLPLYDLFLGRPLHRIAPRDVLRILRA